MSVGGAPLRSLVQGAEIVGSNPMHLCCCVVLDCGCCIMGSCCLLRLLDTTTLFHPCCAPTHPLTPLTPAPNPPQLMGDHGGLTRQQVNSHLQIHRSKLLAGPSSS